MASWCSGPCAEFVCFLGLNHPPSNRPWCVLETWRVPPGWKSGRPLDPLTSAIVVLIQGRRGQLCRSTTERRIFLGKCVKKKKNLGVTTVTIKNQQVILFGFACLVEIIHTRMRLKASTLYFWTGCRQMKSSSPESEKRPRETLHPDCVQFRDTCVITLIQLIYPPGSGLGVFIALDYS